MAFTENMLALSDQDLVIRTSCWMTLADDGYEDDIVIRFNMKQNSVEPLTWELEESFHYEFWGALRYFLKEDPQHEDLEEDSFQIELAEMRPGDEWSEVLYSEYDGPTTEPWNKEIVRAIFKECVWQLTS
jgi:hypothetical protein